MFLKYRTSVPSRYQPRRSRAYASSEKHTGCIPDWNRLPVFIMFTMLNLMAPLLRLRTAKKNHCVCPFELMSFERMRSYSAGSRSITYSRLPLSKFESNSTLPVASNL